MRVRATLFGVGAQLSLDLMAECDLLPNGRVPLHAVLMPGVPQELPSLKLIPQSAGAEVIQIGATLKDSESVPLGRWTASKELIVADVIQQTGPISAEQGATVIVSTLVAQTADATPGLASPSQSWQPVPLQLDTTFQFRLRNACPAALSTTYPPLELSRLWPASNALQAALRIENVRTGQKVSVAVVCAHSASFGRGGDLGVAWWLWPTPYNEDQHKRLSRRHTMLALRTGRAWVSDHSVNKTRLNREELPSDTPELLAQRDRIDLAGVISLTVTELCVHRQNVHALWMDRGDGLAGQLRYLLTNGTAPVAVRLTPGEDPALWIAWLRDQQSVPVLGVCLPGLRWGEVPAGKNARGDSYRISWQPFEAPCEQEHYLLG